MMHAGRSPEVSRLNGQCATETGAPHVAYAAPDRPTWDHRPRQTTEQSLERPCSSVSIRACCARRDASAQSRSIRCRRAGQSTYGGVSDASPRGVTRSVVCTLPPSSSTHRMLWRRSAVCRCLHGLRHRVISPSIEKEMESTAISHLQSGSPAHLTVCQVRCQPAATASASSLRALGAERIGAGLDEIRGARFEDLGECGLDRGRLLARSNELRSIKRR